MFTGCGTSGRIVSAKQCLKPNLLFTSAEIAEISSPDHMHAHAEAYLMTTYLLWRLKPNFTSVLKLPKSPPLNTCTHTHTYAAA